jgi:PAS domain S-box-containing protein
MATPPGHDGNPRPAGDEAFDRRDWVPVALSCIGDGVITADARCRVSYLNPAAERLTGWTLAEAAGEEVERVFRAIDEMARGPVEPPVREVVERGLTVGLGDRTLLVARGGGECPIDASAAAIKEDGDRVVGVVLIFRDITARRQDEGLIESAKAYAESIVATVRGPLLVLDRELHVKSANRSFFETFGVAPPEVLGRFIYDLGDGQWDIPGLRMLLEEIVPENTSFEDFEVEHDFEHIGPKTMLLNARRFPPSGRYELLLLAMEDITERKATETRFRSLLESAPDAMVIVDQAGRIVLVNSQTERLFGHARRDLLGQLMEVLVPVRYHDTHLEHRKAYFGEPKVREMGAGLELFGLHKDGGEFPVEISLSPLETGEGLLVSCAIRDITARKKIIDAVVRSEVRFRRLFEAARDGILLVDPGTRKITDANPFMIELLGYPRDQLVGKELWEIGLLADEAASREAFQQLQKTGTIRYEDLPLQSESGAIRDVEFVSNLYRENGHQVIQCNIRDITDRRRLEEERNRLYRLAEEARARAEANEAKLAEADRRKDEFIAILAHELRNPLSSIGMAAHLLRGSDAAGKREWSLGVIGHQVSALSRLIEDLLDVSRISNGKIRLRKEPLDLAAVLGHAVDSVAVLVRDREHELTVSLPPGPMAVEGDPTRLEQVFVNLLTNAAKYTEKGGHIRLIAAAEGEAIVVRVRDNGEGIAADMIPGLFEMFTQVESSTHRSRGGLGIGLSLVKDLVEMHGGTVTATSEGAGKGSEFVVRLPAASP